MRAFHRSIAALATAGLALTACSGGSSTPSAPIRAATPAPTPTSVTSTSGSSSAFEYNAAFVNAGQLIGPATLGRMSIDVALPMRDLKGLMTYAQAVSEPKSASYRRFLTPTELADRFGASVADQNAAIAYFHRFNMWASGWKQRMVLHVSGTQSQLEAAFHTRFGQYRSKLGETFYAPETAPYVAAGVPVVGSANIVMRTKRDFLQFVTSKGSGTGYAPQQIAAGFDYDGSYNAGYTGTGVTIGIIGTGPVVTSTGGKIGDADAYRQLYKVAGSSTVSEVATTASDPTVIYASGFASPPPVTEAGCPSNPTNPATGLPYSESPTATCNPEDLEAQIDTEQAAMLARDATVDFYLAYNPNDGCTTSGGQPVEGSPCPAGSGGGPVQGLPIAEEEIQTIIDHDTADIVSGSFGGPEISEAGSPSPPYEFAPDGSGLEPTEFAMMVSEGMAVFISSGDDGANSCQQLGGGGAALLDSLCVEYPASDENVVATGGVTTPLNSGGQIAGPIAAWGVQTSGGQDGGTGGGVSAYFPLPSFQSGLAGITGTTRNVPDASLEGDPATGVAVLLYADPSFGGPQLVPVGGTSVAAPEMAAMWALVLQACKQSSACTSKGSGSYPYRLGDPAPLLYSIYSNTAMYGSTFLPVTYGDNSLVEYCSNPANAGDTTDCPTPGPNATATPAVPPLDPGYSANPSGGYNHLTGLGVPFGRALIRAIVGV